MGGRCSHLLVKSVRLVVIQDSRPSPSKAEVFSNMPFILITFETDHADKSLLKPRVSRNIYCIEVCDEEDHGLVVKAPTTISKNSSI
jgi:hypothetical protein